VQTGALAVGAGEAVVDVDALGSHAERLEAVVLGGEVLLVGGDAGAADVQASNRGHSACRIADSRYMRAGDYY